MIENDSNWFSKWEDELPSTEELMPLSQTLISPGLALAFNIQTVNSTEFDSSDLGGGSGNNTDETARTLKRPRLVWTPQLHKRFVDAVAHLGIKNAVPKTIMQLMSVDGLTRENVASHLQKYRLYLKRMQGISSGGVGSGGDPTTDRLFASSPVPPQFMSYLQVAAIQQQQLPHHRHVAMGAGNSQFPTQFGQMGHLGLQPNGQLENPFLARQQQVHGVDRMGTPSYAEDIDSGIQVNGKKVLTLFPTGGD